MRYALVRYSRRIAVNQRIRVWGLGQRRQAHDSTRFPKGTALVDQFEADLAAGIVKQIIVPEHLREAFDRRFPDL